MQLDIIETQNKIIRTQADIIDELFALLSQHIEVAEIEKTCEKMEQVARLKKEAAWTTA